MSGPKGREIVGAFQQARGLGHGARIERARDVPGAVFFERERRLAIDDPVEIDAHGGIAPGIEAGRHFDRVEHDGGRRPQVRVERLAQHRWLCLPGEIQMAALAQRVNAGIGAARTMHAHLFAAEALDRTLQRLLHRASVALILPADEAGAVVFEGQLVAGHGRRVPAGIGRPRSKASVSITALPAR